MKSKINRFVNYSALFVALIILILPELAEARGGGGGRGGSFGGSRGGGGRSFSSPRSSPSPTKSFGGTRSTPTPSANRSMSSAPSAGRSSFGGSRISNGSAYTSKYGVPRQSTPMTRTGANGIQQNYVVHSYGGYGTGLMTGYMLGHSSWMWGMPFHPAYYYSRPYEVMGANGAIEVYPPTFSFGKFFFTLLIFGLILWLIIRLFKRRTSTNGYGSQSSFN